MLSGFLKKISPLVQAILLMALLTGPVAVVQAQRPAGPDRPADFLDPAFHRQRRELLRQKLPARAVAVFFAAAVRNRANDVNYLYHPNPDLYYLTGYDEPNAVLVLFKEPQTLGGKSGITEVLYVQPRDPARELWTGRRLGEEGARQQLGLPDVQLNRDFAAAPIGWSSFGQILFLDLPTDVRDDPRDPADLASLIASFRRKAGIPADYNAARAAVYATIRSQGAANGVAVQTYLEQLAKQDPTLAADSRISAFRKATTDTDRRKAAAAIPAARLNSHSLDEWLNQLREVKTPEELVLLRRAIRISAVAQQEVMKALRPDMSEMEVQGLHEFVYKKYGAEFEGYPSIVGAGANSCVLHYETNDKPRLGNDLILMDCGAEYHGYTADVTRTAPASGKFTPEQRQIYDLVYQAQQAAIEQCQPGNEFFAPNKAAQKVVIDGLIALGIIKDATEMRRYFPHGTSHYLGLDVHDRGTYGPLKAGNVLTVEPGIYIPEGSPCDKKWWNIGVRIEDDILVTATGWENLSVDAPRTASAVEALMAQPSVLDNFRLPELK